MIKLYLASFLQPYNFGPGRVIGIVPESENRPRDIDVSTVFPYFTPETRILTQYRVNKPIQPKIAAEVFDLCYKEQLEAFINEVIGLAKVKNLSPTELLPFESGVSLCSWERCEYSNYRKTLAPFLVQLGYEVVLN